MSKALTRRHFLALSTAAAVAAPRAAASRQRSGTLRIGIIGMGCRGSELANAIRDRSEKHGCRLAVVCDPDIRRCASFPGGVTDWREVIEGDLDAVLIATPDYLHAPLAIAAMETGKHVYCEAPLARTVDEAAAIRRVAAATKRVFGVAASEPLTPVWRAAKSIVAEERIGDVYWCQSSGTPRTSPTGSSWRDEWETSAGLATGAFFDRLTAMMCATNLGIPDRVTVAGGNYSGSARQIPDSYVASFEYQDGPRFVMTTAPAHGNGSPTVIRGSRGTLHVSASGITLETETGKMQEMQIPEKPTDALDHWLVSLRTGMAGAVDAEIAYPVAVATAMANNAYRSGCAATFDTASASILPAVTRVRTA